MEVGMRVRLLVCAVVVGERACHVPASRSSDGPCSPPAHPAAPIPVSCNGMAFTAPRVHIDSRQRRVTWLSLKPSLLRPRDVVAGAVHQRRPSSLASDRAELPWSGPTFNEAFGQDNNDNDNREEGRDDTGVPEQQPRASPWTNDIWEGDWEGSWDDMATSRGDEEETGIPLPPSGVPGGVRVGSQEFTDLVKAQFDVLATVLTEASEIVLFTRQENSETGGFEFVHALEYPESEDGTQRREEPEDMPSTGNTVDAFSESGMPVQNMAGQMNPPKTVENDDGSLSAPIVYASVVMGMITVWGEKRNQAKEASGGEGSGDEPVLAGAEATTTSRMSWDKRDKKVLEKVASSVAMAAVLDQKQRWAAVMQVQQLRGVIAESLHQVKNPMTALRTFGKLLLRRLPPDDTLNRELAKDILLQSDRVVDLLLPIDAVIGLLGQAVDTADSAAATSVAGATGIAGGGMLPQFDGFPGAAPASSSTSASTAPGGEWAEPSSSRGEGQEAGSVPWSVSQEVQDALLSASPSEDWAEARVPVASAVSEAPPAAVSVPVGLVSVQDVVRKVAVATEADAEARRVCFQCRVDNAVPGALGCASALEEALSIVLKKTIQYHEMVVSGGKSDQDKAVVELTARACTQAEWGGYGGVIIGVTGKNGQETDADEVPHTFDKGCSLDQGNALDQGYGDQKAVGTAAGAVDSVVGAVDSAVGERLDLDLGTAAELMRSCGGDLIVAKKDERGWGTEVKLFLPNHRTRLK